MKFKLILLFYVVVSCTTNYNNSYNKTPYNSKGFAYIFNQADYDNKIIKTRLNDELSANDAANKERGDQIAQYEAQMKEMRKHFENVADSWIASIREISPEFAKVNVEFPFVEL